MTNRGVKLDYEVKNNHIVIKNNIGFNLKDTLECGQCFRFEVLSDYEYLVIAFGKLLRIKDADGEVTFFDTTPEDFENIWIPYFDFARDYDSVKSALKKKDDFLKTAVEYAPGIKILNQDFFECLISFIISQNNQIPNIKRVIANLSEAYSYPLGTVNGKTYYAFPTADALLNAGIDGLMKCKTGFRAKYITDACKKFISGEISLEKISKMDTPSAKELLMSIKGVGPKVSDCVLLFSLGRREVFPTDVWVRRVMSELYFSGNPVKINEIQDFAKSGFGPLAGFAQQYLFYYARTLKIGAKK